MRTIEDLRSNQRQARAGGAFAMVLLLGGLLLLPIAGHPLQKFAVMMPVYQTAIGIINLLTALLLLLQFQQSRRSNLAILASAFSFAGFMALLQLFFFPGVLDEILPLTMNTEVPAQIWLMSNIGFPLLLGVALLSPGRLVLPTAKREHVRGWGFVAVGVPLLTGLLLAGLASTGLTWHPTAAGQSAYPSLIPKPVAWGMFFLNVAVFVTLTFQTRLKRRMELWLAVIMLGIIVHLGLTFLAGDRYSVAWYAARVIHIISATGVLVVFLWEVHLLYQTAFRLSAGLREQAARDGLTKVFSRRYFERKFGEVLRLQQKSNTPLTLMLIDIDHFKSYNDEFGHLAGDHCLTTVAQEIESFFHRDGQFLARYGGEEFAIVLPRMGDNRAVPVAEDVRRAVESLFLSAGSELLRTVTVSVGIGFLPPGIKSVEAAQIIQAADVALYSAKRAGRNCVRMQFLEGSPAAARQLTRILSPA